jgi:transcriptional regulator with XRE-family HTH domain
MTAKSKWGVDIQREIPDLMRKYKLSREDIASRLGVSMMTIYRWENGKTIPQSRLTMRELEKLKQELEKK